jgi:hypothetical protein
METSEPIIHSFIIKIRIEEIFADHVVWRGHIVHVPSKDGRYFLKLSDISTFIAGYLENEVEKAGKQPGSE